MDLQRAAHLCLEIRPYLPSASTGALCGCRGFREQGSAWAVEWHQRGGPTRTLAARPLHRTPMMSQSDSHPKNGKVLHIETTSSRSSRCHNSLGLTGWNGTIPSHNLSGWSSHSQMVGEGRETDGGLLVQVVVLVASATE